MERECTDNDMINFILTAYVKAGIRFASSIEECDVVTLTGETSNHFVLFTTPSFYKAKLKETFPYILCFLKVRHKRYIKKLTSRMLFF